MHPILAARGRLALYLAAWLLLEALLVWTLVLTGGIGWRQAAVGVIPPYLAYGFACLSTWYLCRAFPLGQTAPATLAVVHAAAPAALSGLWAALAYSWASGAGRAVRSPALDERLAEKLPVLFAAGFLLALLSVAVNYLLLAFAASQEAEQRAAEARVLARDAELRALKAQVNPHFLFNCLHSISALTSVDGGRARDMCIKLADFLRSTLGLGEQATIALGEELKLLRSYLAVEQVRFGARLCFEEDIDPGAAGCAVPALLLQPLVENAVKHGISTLTGGGYIRVSVKRGEGRLRLEIENNFDPEAPAPRKSGVGLRNVRERLRARYEREAVLTAAGAEGVFRVKVELPCEPGKR